MSYLALATLTFATIFSTELATSKTAPPVVQTALDKKEIQNCLGRKNQEACLMEIFKTKSKLVVVQKGPLKEISISPFSLNNVKLGNVIISKLQNPTFEIDTSKNTIRVCGISQSGYQIEDSNFVGRGCTCELPVNGNFKYSLDNEYSSLVSTKNIEVTFPACLPDNVISGSGIEILSNRVICGANFPRGTVFGPAESGIQFFATADIKSQNSNDVRFKVGEIYINGNPTQDPCNWELKPVPETDE